MKKYSLAIAMTIAVIVVPAATFAGFGDCKSAGCGEDCSTGGCEPVLQAERKWVDIEKKCWEVECKEVAIPPVKLPRFGDCLKAIRCGKTVGILPETGGSSCTGCANFGCTGECGSPGRRASRCGSSTCDSGKGLMSKLFGHHACGRVRTVGKLKSSSSKVKKQVVEWKIIGGSEGCGKSCTSGCTSGGCAPYGN